MSMPTVSAGIAGESSPVTLPILMKDGLATPAMNR